MQTPLYIFPPSPEIKWNNLDQNFDQLLSIFYIIFANDPFSEICLLTHARRTATIVAKTMCDIFILHAEDFREVVEEFPEMRHVMESVASERLSRMGKSVDFSNSACPSRECLLAKLQTSASRRSSICCSCTNLLQPRENNPEIVITREVSSDDGKSINIIN